jgi:hypothetical protein
VRAADGSIVSFDPSGSINTYPQDINSEGAVAGYYENRNHIDHGFLRASDGTITAFHVSGSTGTNSWNINGKGAIAGFYADGNNVVHGFVRKP